METAEEFLDANTSGIIDEIKCKELMIEFAKLHVEAALQSANENVRYDYSDIEAIQKLILDAYPLTNIK